MMLTLFFKSAICAVKWILKGVVMRIYNLITRYLCVNSALHHLRPPLRGLKLLFAKVRPSVNFIDFRITSPLRGLKLTIDYCVIK